MQAPPASFVELLQKKILPNVQRIALLLSLAGLLFTILNYPGASELLLIGLSALASAYFLMAFMPLQIPTGVKPSLYVPMLLKIIYLGCSVISIGALFQFLKLEGGGQMLLVGTSATGVALLASGTLAVGKKDNWIPLKDAIIRGSGIFLLGIFMLRQSSII
jgi:hypothetical protein